MSERKWSGQTGGARKTTPSTRPAERFEVYLGNIHVEELHDAVPDNVLITKVVTELDPGRGGRNITGPPFDRIPPSPKLIEDEMTLETPIWYIQNGLMDARGSYSPIGWPAAVDGIADMMDWFRSNRPQDARRVYISELEFVEVPERFAEVKHDRKTVDWNALADPRRTSTEDPVAHIGTVRRRPAPVNDDKVRRRIGSSLLGSTTKPRMLTEHKRVTVIPDHKYDRTLGKRYWQVSQASSGKCSMDQTPEVHDFLETPLNETFAGLSAEEAVQRLFPSAASSPLLDVYRLTGETTTSDNFTATDASQVM